MSLAKQEKVIEAFPQMSPEARLSQKKKRRRERRCWWTFPLRHHYKNEYCVWCKKWDPPDMGY